MDNPLLLESIRLIDGEFPLLPFHQERVDRSFKKFFPKASPPKLRMLLEQRGYPDLGLYKVRVLYQLDNASVEAQLYTPKEVNSLRIVAAESVKYPQKLANREAINTLFDLRNGCDDILMTQHGFITDTSYANIALFDGRKWITPAWPLLRGTRRAKLIQEGLICPSVIRVKDLEHFQEIRLFNAMLPWETAPRLAVSSIIRD